MLNVGCQNRRVLSIIVEKLAVSTTLFTLLTTYCPIDVTEVQLS
jgi:hypothetical protein